MVTKNINFKKTFFQLIISLTIIFCSGFLVYRNFIKSNLNDYILTPLEEKMAESKVSQFEQLIKIFEKESFKKLIKFGNWPVEVKEKGKSNPFLKI